MITGITVSGDPRAVDEGIIYPDQPIAPRYFVRDYRAGDLVVSTQSRVLVVANCAHAEAAAYSPAQIVSAGFVYYVVPKT